jgi:hypothetical protein
MFTSSWEVGLKQAVFVKGGATTSIPRWSSTCCSVGLGIDILLFKGACSNGFVQKF